MFPGKPSFKKESDVKTFTVKQKWEWFTISRPSLNEEFLGILQKMTSQKVVWEARKDEQKFGKSKKMFI